MPRGLVIVMDSAGVGALPDAAKFGDAPGANTIGNVAERCGGLNLPNFERLGLGAITPIRGVPKSNDAEAFVARLAERSNGKDTITGHWEMAGIRIDDPFPTYPNGFPPEVIAEFTAICAKPPLGNIPASGTEIIESLGAQHMETGCPILYTSADSVFQVAAHEDIVPLAQLYDWCERARAMLTPPHQVNRVIARPFTGAPGRFARTANRRDYAIDPPDNLLDRLTMAGIPVYGIGKIGDIYNGRGLSASVRIADNDEAVTRAVELLERTDRGFIFVNLNDFDSKFGHRRDVRGYAGALECLDARIPEIESRLRPGDLAIFTADHGCDPTAPGSDHTREYVPMVELGARRGDGGVIDGMSVVGERIASTVMPNGVPA
jgi:phosphopentomutase